MRYFLSLSSLLVAASAHAVVNDVLPADYIPLAKGTSTLAVYAVDRQSTGPYSNESKLLDGNLSSQIAVLRGSYFLDMGETPVALTAVLPWSQNSVGPASLAGALGKEASGFGDIRFGATAWMVANRVSGEYFGVTGTLFLPTGAYSNQQVLNAAENRYKFTMNAGWVHQLNTSFILEVLPEVAWYGDNKSYVGGRNLSQKLSYSLSSYLRYRANPTWQFHLGAQINRGGETQINGVDQNNPPDNTRVMAGTTYLTEDKANQWIIRVARDTEVKNGFMTTSEVLIRYMKFFK